jgi:hypothetical protein
MTANLSDVGEAYSAVAERAIALVDVVTAKRNK